MFEQRGNITRSSIMQLLAVRGVAYRSVCICAYACILMAAIMLGIYSYVGTDQELQALRILRSKPEIYEYLSWDTDTDM